MTNPFQPASPPEDAVAPSHVRTVPVNPPIVIKGAEVTRFEVRPISFLAFVEAAFSAVSAGETSATKIEAAIIRRRILRQARAFAGAAPIEFEEFDILSLPPSVGRALVDAVREDDRPEGEVLGKGDGLYSPILYRLGTPIGATLNGEAGGISEIEFFAATYGQVEEVIVEDQPLRRAAALITSVGKPVDMMSMPSWVANEISLVDGLKIMREVLPSFL